MDPGIREWRVLLEEIDRVVDYESLTSEGRDLYSAHLRRALKEGLLLQIIEGRSMREVAVMIADRIARDIVEGP